MNFSITPLTSDGKVVEPNAPLIYLWEIVNAEGKVVGRYVGKADGGTKRPLKHYKRNVIKLLKGLPYKSGKSYRRIHYGLAAAVQAGHTINLTYICNVPSASDIFEVEASYIRAYGCLDRDGVGLNGPGPRPDVIVVPATATLREVETDLMGEQEAETEDHGLHQLEYIQRFILEEFPQLVDTPRKQGISFWLHATERNTCSGGKEGRILRAELTSSGKKVMLKRAQSHRSDPLLPEVVWDGTDAQVREIVQLEIEEYYKRAPKGL